LFDVGKSSKISSRLCYKARGEGYMKKLTAKTFYRLFSKLPLFLFQDTGDFRIMDRRVVDGSLPNERKS
jgi:hypothetical protein